MVGGNSRANPKSSNSRDQLSKKYKRRLTDCLSVTASLINAGNDNLWPIFEKIEKELLAIDKQNERLSKYL